MEKAKAAPGNQHNGSLVRDEGSKTPTSFGITHSQSSDWQKLPKVPEQKFQSALKDTTKPTLINHCHVVCGFGYCRLRDLGQYYTC